MHTTIKEMLSTQHEQEFTGLTIFILCVRMDLTMILPSPDFGAVDIINQELSNVKI